MSGKSSRPGAWWSALEPAAPELFRGRGDPEDPRLGEVVRRWPGDLPEVRPGQAVLVGFPCDEGVRRNHGRPGAALAPDAVRGPLYRFTSWDPVAGVDLANLDILDLGNLRVDPDLKIAQEQLGEVVAALLRAGTVPIILGGGHETAFGHYLGYAGAGVECAIINIDAHLDVRSFDQGPHSGSPFRQAFQYAPHPLKPGRYVVLGAQRYSVARAHWEYVERRQGRVHWFTEEVSSARMVEWFAEELSQLGKECPAILVTIDADAFRQADVPGVSAPNPLGLHGAVWPEIAGRAGAHLLVRSIEVVEINPHFDRDEQSARCAALGLRQFLVGLAARR